MPDEAAPIEDLVTRMQVDPNPALADDDAGRRGSTVPALLASVRHQRRWAAGAALIVLLATTATYVAMPRRYDARADVWLDHGIVQAGVKDAGTPLARNTEVRLLTSNDLAAQVVERLGLANVRGIGLPADGSPRDADLARRTAIATLRDNLTVATTGTSYAVAAHFRAGDPVLAAGILNQLVDRYVEERRVGGERGREREGMRAQVAAAHDEVIRAESAVSGFRAASDLVRRRGEAGSFRNEIAGLEAALAVARTEQASAVARMRAAAGSSRLRDLTEQRATLRNQRTTFAGLPNQLAVTDARLVAVNRDLAAERQRIGQLGEPARAAGERVAALGSALDRARREQRAERAAATQIDKYRDTLDAARRRFAELSGRFERLIAEQRGHEGTAYVIAHADPRGVARSPNPLWFVLGGLIGALVAAALAVLAREWLTKGFRNRQHLERLLGIPVIGLVPDLAKTPGVDVADGDAMGPPDYLYTHQRSPFSAAFRAIHTGLRLGRTAHSARSVAVSSALQEEGKTTVAICLARSAALAGLRVVLVDCDARRPAASRALSAHVEVGLAEVLEDRVHFRRALQCDMPSGAWFLAHSSERPVANGIIDTAALEDLIGALTREFDLVVLDTPPALALSEAREVAAMADTVLLVARSRTTPTGATRIAYDQLVKAGAKVDAAALTLVDPRG